MSERVLTVPLLAFLCAVGGIALSATFVRRARPDIDEALQLLADGDLERRERDRIWHAVRALALVSQSRAHWLAGAMAAVCLGDRQAFADLSARLGGGDPPVTGSDAALLEQACLGESCLWTLLQGWNAERAGRREEAAKAYRQAAAAAPLWRLPMAGELARQGAERVR